MLNPRFLSIGVFVICFSIGIFLAGHKALWNDEIFTQRLSVQNATYQQIITGNLPEGSNAPLFYILQKFVVSPFGYHLPLEWNERRILDPQGQIIIRLLVNVLMSAIAAWMVYFFAVRYSWAAGVLCLLTCLTNQMFLYHWVEARPYALWFVLSALQFLVAISVISDKKESNVRILYWIHAALALTIIFSFFQIVLLAVFLWLKGYRRWMQVFLLLILPAAIGVFYRMKIGAYGAFPYMVVNPLGLIHDVFGLDRLFLICGIGCVFVLGIKRKIEAQQIIKFLSGFGALLFVMAGLLLAYFYMQRQGDPGPTLNSRCLIFMAPFEIIATVFFIVSAYCYVSKNLSKHYAMCFIGVIILFYAARILMLYQNTYADALYAY